MTNVVTNVVTDVITEHLPLYRALMFGQINGTVTEGDLINCARFWFYDGYTIQEGMF